MIDGRHRRSERSRVAIRAAIERLRSGTATHARHIGIRVAITKQAVAREAGVSSSTLYRFPELVGEIESCRADVSVSLRVRSSEQRRKKLVDELEERDRRIDLLLSENLRLMRALEQHDIDLNDSPVVLSVKRAERDRS